MSEINLQKTPIKFPEILIVENSLSTHYKLVFYWISSSKEFTPLKSPFEKHYELFLRYIFSSILT